MKTKTRLKSIVAALAALIVGLATGLTLSATHAEAQSLPACATGGDMDLDGVPDTEDVSQTDSCLCGLPGYPSCQVDANGARTYIEVCVAPDGTLSGEGDGLPDCASQ